MFDRERARSRLAGCYVTVPTMFRDPDLEVDYAATRRNVRFLLDGGIRLGTGVLLAVGAAGDFSTMTFEERVRTAEAICEEAAGQTALVMGAQTTSTRELVRLARAAERLGAEYIQVSPPFYFHHTAEDFYEYVLAAAEAAPIGIVVYNTFWTSSGVSFGMLERLCKIPNVIGLKWATPWSVSMEFDRVIDEFRDHLCVIDNHMHFVSSHILGARGFEVHVCNFWPEWGVQLIESLRERRYAEVQQQMMQVAVPFYKLWSEIEREYTSGDGYLDKLCMELVGLDSSRSRPPTRDIRGLYREKARQMLLKAGVPRVKTA
ncbi:MAG: dihydrodipicolinate synthase family protein [Acidimicrobiia bacterium]|nr:dihydrodipicolinate synthase family protein [Acidimicrobiia bacterium]